MFKHGDWAGDAMVEAVDSYWDGKLRLRAARSLRKFIKRQTPLAQVVLNVCRQHSSFYTPHFANHCRRIELPDESIQQQAPCTIAEQKKTATSISTKNCPGNLVHFVIWSPSVGSTKPLTVA